jgi:hypothetical protein
MLIQESKITEIRNNLNNKYSERLSNYAQKLLNAESNFTINYVEEVFLNNEENVLEIFEWFFDPIGNRQSGRSYLLANVFLNIAKKYLNEKIYVTDHIKSNTDRLKHLIDLISNIYLKSEDFKIYNLENSNEWIKLSIKEI